MEDTWSRDWNDDSSGGTVKFVGFYDDTGAPGTLARMLEEITLSGGVLMFLSYALIAVFSIAFLASSDLVESRVGVTFCGVLLVILSFFSALGLTILIGIKLNVTIG